MYHFSRSEASLPTQMLTCTPRNYPKYVYFPRILPFSMHAVQALDTYPRLLLDIFHTHLKFSTLIACNVPSAQRTSLHLASSHRREYAHLDWGLTSWF